MGYIRVMEGGFRRMHKEGTAVELSITTCSGRGSQKSHVLTGCSSPIEQLNQPWCGLWGLRVSDVPSPRGQPAAGMVAHGMERKDFFSPVWACAAGGSLALHWGCGAQKAKG